MRDLVAGFADLFEGRRDAYGTEDGGCWRPKGVVDWASVVDAHLDGDYPIGVYPMLHHPNHHGPHWLVKWGCVDLDVKREGKRRWDYETESDAHEAAVDLQATLNHVGCTSWIERTRSCGRHVWLFADTWTPAKTMRNALLVACQVAGVSTREVNPKQSTLSEGQLGNYVRLPYPGGLNHVDHGGDPRRVMVLPNYELGYVLVREFVEHALEQRTPVATLEEIAAKYKEPEKPFTDLMDREWRATVKWAEETARKLNVAGRTVAECGPDDGDRSRGMSYVAYQARLSGYTQAETYTLLKSLHWNKFAGRRDEDQRLQEIVIGAWQ